MKLLLNTVFKSTTEQRGWLQASRPGLELAEQNAAAVGPLNAPHTLFSLPNLILTPQMAGGYEGFRDPMGAPIANNLRRHQQGATHLNPVSHRFSH
jgi:lactate dehydrogenase-like 2-hydroxyacid dehydrogenase